MELPLPLPPRASLAELGEGIAACVRDRNWQATESAGGWRIRFGAPFALHPDALPFTLVIAPEPDGVPAARALFPSPPWQRRAFAFAVRKRAEAALAAALAAPPPAPSPARRAGFPVRSFSLFASLLLSTCAGIAVFWAYGLALLDATPQEPPAYFGVPRLAELPFAVRFWSAWFVAFSMGYPMGFLAGLLCCAAEYGRPLAAGLSPALAALGAWLAWMTFVPGVRVWALLLGAALPAACWAAYGLPWGWRQEGDA